MVRLINSINVSEFARVSVPIQITPETKRLNLFHREYKSHQVIQFFLASTMIEAKNKIAVLRDSFDI